MIRAFADLAIALNHGPFGIYAMRPPEAIVASVVGIVLGVVIVFLFIWPKD